MAIYLVSYDLIGPNRDYERVTKHMRTYGTRAKPLESVWLVKSDLSAGDVRDEVMAHVDANDKVLVVELAAGWGTKRIAKDVTDWMHEQL